MNRISPLRLGLSALPLLLLLRLPLAVAQQPPPAPVAGDSTGEPSFEVQSDPSGAIVTLSGPYEWVGQTPWRLFRNLTGAYRVEARLPGYETWHDEITLGPGGIRELNIRLGRRTRWKAMARSLIVPGWGQSYLGERWKGGVLTTLAVLSLGGVLWTQIEYHDRVNDFNRAKVGYEAASRQQDLPVLWQKVLTASTRADNAYNRRQIASGVTAGVWGLALLDAFLFAPQGEARPSLSDRGTPPGDGPGLHWTAAAGPQAVQAGLRCRWR